MLDYITATTHFMAKVHNYPQVEMSKPACHKTSEDRSKTNNGGYGTVAISFYSSEQIAKLGGAVT